jgi:uncharacterized integral membrane protein
MPWRLLGLAVLFAALLLFIGLNLNNRCDISFWFTQEAVFKDVPVYLTVLASFILGLLCSIPFAVSLLFRKRARNKSKEAPVEAAAFAEGGKKKKKDKKQKDEEIRDVNDGSYGID